MVSNSVNILNLINLLRLRGSAGNKYDAMNTKLFNDDDKYKMLYISLTNILCKMVYFPITFSALFCFNEGRTAADFAVFHQ